MRDVHLGDPYSTEDAPFPFFNYASPNHLEGSVSTALCMGSPDWVPTPSTLEGFGWPVASPGNSFAMCPRLSSAPNLQHPFEIIALRALHTSWYGSVTWESGDEEDDDDSSMCSALAEMIRLRAGAVGMGPCLYKHEAQSYPFSRLPSSVFKVPRSLSASSCASSTADTTSAALSVEGLVDVATSLAIARRPSTSRDESGALAFKPTYTSAPNLLFKQSWPSSVCQDTSTTSYGDAAMPVTGNPSKIARQVALDKPFVAISAVKESESDLYSDIALLLDLPLTCVATPARGITSSPSSPVDVSDFSASTGSCTFSAMGTSPEATLTLTDDSTEESSAGNTSASTESSPSSRKPWAKRIMEKVRVWLKPTHRRN